MNSSPVWAYSSGTSVSGSLKGISRKRRGRKSKAWVSWLRMLWIIWGLTMV